LSSAGDLGEDVRMDDFQERVEIARLPTLEDTPHGGDSLVFYAGEETS
jgi:hypothetical protein